MSDLTKINLSINNMTCGSCVGRVENVLKSISGVHDVSVNLVSESATFLLEASSQINEITKALITAGYPAEIEIE